MGQNFQKRGKEEEAWDLQITFSHVNLLFFLFDKGKWFVGRNLSSICFFLPVILSIVTHLEYCNDQKLQSSWGSAPDPIFWVYSASTTLHKFSLRENYKYRLWTLPLQSMRHSDGRIMCLNNMLLKQNIADILCHWFLSIKNLLKVH